MKEPKWETYLIEINEIETLELKATSEETVRWAVRMLHPSHIYSLKITKLKNFLTF